MKKAISGRDFGWEIAREAVSRRPPIPLDVMVARTCMYTYDTKVTDLSTVQGSFSVAPCQTLTLRFATLASLYQARGQPGHLLRATGGRGGGAGARARARDGLQQAGVRAEPRARHAGGLPRGAAAGHQAGLPGGESHFTPSLHMMGYSDGKVANRRAVTGRPLLAAWLCPPGYGRSPIQRRKSCES
jgi:hypothetical protein